MRRREPEQAFSYLNNFRSGTIEQRAREESVERVTEITKHKVKLHNKSVLHRAEIMDTRDKRPAAARPRSTSSSDEEEEEECFIEAEGPDHEDGHVDPLPQLPDTGVHHHLHVDIVEQPTDNATFLPKEKWKLNLC